MKRACRSLAFAFGFLTVIPGLGKVRVEGREVGLSTVFYPLVGLLLGLVVYGIALIGRFHPLSRAFLSCLALLVLTRGMHLDGVLDTFDGLLCGKSREEARAVMKDSRVGALGLLGGLCVYGLKCVLLFEIFRGEYGIGPLLLLPPALARGGVALWGLAGRRGGGSRGRITAYPENGRMVEGEGRGSAGKHGLGSSLLSSLAPAHAVGAILLMFLICGATLRPFAFLLLPAVLAVWILWGLICRGRLGGMTGDTFGAGIEIGETAGYALIPILPVMGDLWPIW